MADVIRKLKYKQSDGSFTPAYNIGSTDEFIKMLSGYSLTEEFYLGPPTITRFVNKDDNFEIIQEFIDVNSENVDTDGFKFYELRTTFDTSEKNNMKIIQVLRHCIEHVNEDAGEVQGYTKKIINKKTTTFWTDENGEFSIDEEYENGIYNDEQWGWNTPTA